MLLEILVHSGGGRGWGCTKKDCVPLLQGPFDSQREHQPPTSCWACVIPAEHLREGFYLPCEVCWCHRAIQCSLQMWSLWCTSLAGGFETTVTIKGITKNHSTAVYYHTLVSLWNHLIDSFVLGGGSESVVIHPNSHSECSAPHFLFSIHLHHIPKWGRALISCSFITINVMRTSLFFNTSHTSLIHTPFAHWHIDYAYISDETRCQSHFPAT